MAPDDEDDEVDNSTTALHKSARAPALHDEPLPDFVHATLEVISGPPGATPYVLKKIGTRIGRGETADIRIRDEGVSRWHATIEYANDEFRVSDLSANGTFLNGSKVKEYVVRNGDKLLIGETVLLFRKTID